MTCTKPKAVLKFTVLPSTSLSCLYLESSNDQVLLKVFLFFWKCLVSIPQQSLCYSTMLCCSYKIVHFKVKSNILVLILFWGKIFGWSFYRQRRIDPQKNICWIFLSRELWIVPFNFLFAQVSRRYQILNNFLKGYLCSFENPRFSSIVIIVNTELFCSLKIYGFNQIICSLSVLLNFLSALSTKSVKFASHSVFLEHLK